jgi:hypothetical protein
VTDTTRVIIRNMHSLFKVNSLYDSKFDCRKYRCPLTAMQAYGVEEVRVAFIINIASYRAQWLASLPMKEQPVSTEQDLLHSSLNRKT